MSKPLILCLFGTFNPITRSHINLMKIAYLHATNVMKQKVTKCLIIPTSQHYPYKQDSITSNVDREEMCRLAIEEENELPEGMILDIDRIELEMNEWMRTRLVVDLLAIKYPENHIKFLCGGDKLYEFTKYGERYRNDSIHVAKEYGMISVEREGFPFNEEFISELDILDDVEFVRLDEPLKFSSTEIREPNKQDTDPLNIIHESVLNYIQINDLY